LTDEFDIEELMYPVSIDVEFVPKPGDVEDLVYRLLCQNGCMKGADIRSTLRSRNVMVGERKLRRILNYLIYRKLVYYDAKRKMYCVNGGRT